MSDIGEMGHLFKDWFEISAIAIGALAGLFIGWVRIRQPVIDMVRAIMGRGKGKKSVDFSIDKNIHEYLNRLRFESNACRAKLFQYHNGGSFSNGKSMKKMSMTHESCHPGMVPTFRGNSDLVLSLFSDMLELVHANEPTLLNTAILRDSYFKSYLQSNHVLMFSVLPVRNTKGDEIGCLLCEWCAWEFADRVEQDRFYDKFAEARNSIDYVLSTERKR